MCHPQYQCIFSLGLCSVLLLLASICWLVTAVHAVCGAAHCAVRSMTVSHVEPCATCLFRTLTSASEAGVGLLLAALLWSGCWMWMLDGGSA
jgi:hypothetical protein